MLILASESQARLSLLDSINIAPDQVLPANIDETALKHELPSDLASRLSLSKAKRIAENVTDAIILAADTVSAIGRRVLEKAETDEHVKTYMELFSGRRHQVYSAVCVLKVENGVIVACRQRLVKSTLKFKRLEDSEINYYVESKQGIGKSGGCNIEGLAGAFIIYMQGSASGVMGLPLYETCNLLKSVGYNR